LTRLPAGFWIAIAMSVAMFVLAAYEWSLQ